MRFLSKFRVIATIVSKDSEMTHTKDILVEESSNFEEHILPSWV